jgi:hypothetical protein
VNTADERPDIHDGETGFDRTLLFTVPDRDARGRVVRLGPVLDRILRRTPIPHRSSICWPKRWC